MQAGIWGHPPPGLLRPYWKALRRRQQRWSSQHAAAAWPAAAACLLLLAAVGSLLLLLARGLPAWSSDQAVAGPAHQHQHQRHRHQQPQAQAVALSPVLSTGRDHLVLYAFSYTDPEFLANLQYFVREAVTGDALADFIIIVQEAPNLERVSLPALPPHAAYVHHANECYDWGTYGWLLLRSGKVDVAAYRYFFFVNSSVKGPFLPAYARGRVHWMSAFTSRLTDSVRLVGSTISCEGSPLHGQRKGEWRRNPHVQSYAVATDAAGLQLLIADAAVFGCHKDRWDTIFYSELGSSKAILDAGFNIDCLMLRYQGVDWRDRANWNCNGRLSPTGEFGNDGGSLDPLEVMFVKAKSHLVAGEAASAKKALKYAAWQAQSSAWPPGDFSALAANEFVDARAKFRAPHVLVARARGARCFDFDAYMKANPDLKHLWGNITGLWYHFVYTGQFEPRQFRWTCDLDYKMLTAWPGIDEDDQS